MYKLLKTTPTNALNNTGIYAMCYRCLNLCLSAPLEIIKCTTTAYPFANFEGCCADRTHQQFESPCAAGKGNIVDDCRKGAALCERKT